MFMTFFNFLMLNSRIRIRQINSDPDGNGSWRNAHSLHVLYRAYTVGWSDFEK